MRKLLLVFLVLCLVALLAGCGASSWKFTDQATREDFSSGKAMPPPAAEPGRVAPDGSDGASEQRVIRTGDISLDVEKLDDTLAEVTHLTRVAGGFLAQSNIYGADDERRANLTLRVPVAKFDELLDQIEALGKSIQRSTGGEDVTLHYVDLEARIRNLERQEERLLEILLKADTVEDILRVEQELSRVRGQLESLTAEFRYLSDRVNYATIQLYLRETATASTTITGTGLKGVWQRGWSGLVKSVNAMLTGLGNLLVSLFTLLPYLLLLTVVGIPVLFLIRRFGKGPSTPGD